MCALLVFCGAPAVLFFAAKVANIAAIEALLAAGADARHVMWIPLTQPMRACLYAGETALSVACSLEDAWNAGKLADAAFCIRVLLAATQPQGSLAARCLAAPESFICHRIADVADIMAGRLPSVGAIGLVCASAAAVTLLPLLLGWLLGSTPLMCQSYLSVMLLQQLCQFGPRFAAKQMLLILLLLLANFLRPDLHLLF